MCESESEKADSFRYFVISRRVDIFKDESLGFLIYCVYLDLYLCMYVCILGDEAAMREYDKRSWLEMIVMMNHQEEEQKKGKKKTRY